MIVLIDAPLSEDQASQIQRLSSNINLVRVSPFGQPLPTDVLKEAEVIYTTAANFDLADAPKLRWVQTNTAATNPQEGSMVLRSTVPVANVVGAYTPAVAECAIGMLLAVIRRITLGVQSQLNHHWPEDYAPWVGDDLYGMTMGIVGYGSIGRHIARIADAMGMKIFACKRTPDSRRNDSYLLPGTGDPEGKIPIAWFGEKQVAEMFQQVDVAMIVLPHVPTTEKIIGMKELAALPKRAYLVSIGRGAVIDESALINSLQCGSIAGAALDVFVEEPLPPSSPLWDMANVLIMPHIGSWTKLQGHRAAELLIENLKRDLKGEPLLNLISKKLLY